MEMEMEMEESTQRPPPRETLQDRFSDLQEAWQSFTQSRRKRRSRVSQDHSLSSSTIFLVRNSSPRDLMSSLQTKGSPKRLGGRESESAEEDDGLVNEETAKGDRKVVFECGEFLKGRRLSYEDSDGEIEEGFDGPGEICAFCSSLELGYASVSGDLDQDHCGGPGVVDAWGNSMDKGGRSVPSCCHGFNGSACCACSNSPLDQCDEITGGREEKWQGKSGDLIYQRRRSRLNLGMTCAFVLVVASILGILRRYHGFGDEKEVVLFPT